MNLESFYSRMGLDTRRFSIKDLRGEYQLDVGNGHSIFGVNWEKTINDRKIKFRT